MGVVAAMPATTWPDRNNPPARIKTKAMTQKKGEPSSCQLLLPGFPVALAPGYPRRGLLRVVALCVIYHWPRLEALAWQQLTNLRGAHR